MPYRVFRWFEVASSRIRRIAASGASGMTPRPAFGKDSNRTSASGSTSTTSCCASIRTIGSSSPPRTSTGHATLAMSGRFEGRDSWSRFVDDSGHISAEGEGDLRASGEPGPAAVDEIEG